MVKLNGPLFSAALLSVSLGTTFVLVEGLGLSPSSDRPRQPAGIVLGEHQYVIRCLAFAPDGKTLATGGGFATVPAEIKLWDLVAGTQRTTLHGKQKGIYAVTFSPDGKTLATASLDQEVTLWDVASGRELASVPTFLPHSLYTALAPDGETLALAGWGEDPSTVHLWHVAPEPQYALTGGSGPVRFSADGRRLALWRLATDEDSVTSPADGQAIVPTTTSGHLPTLQYWDIPPGRQTLTWRGDTCFVWALAFSPDSRTLASGGFDDTVRLWDAATGRERTTLRGHTDQVGALAFAPNGRSLVSGSHDGTVRLWDPTTGRELATLWGHAGRVTCVAFSPDGQWVASGSHDQRVRLWPVMELR